MCHSLLSLAGLKPHSAPAPGDTDMQEHVYQKPVRDVNGLKWHLTETCSATSQQSLFDQVIDQWQDCFNTCLKAKSKRFEHWL